MRNDFIFHNPTKIYFGREALSHLPSALSEFGPRVLLVYGKGAIKRIGLYDRVVAILKEAGKEIFELSGVSPNPRYSEVLRGASLVRENQIDLILAVGGGSVIDCAKAISVSAYCEGDPWKKYWVDFLPLDNPVVAVGAILTMAGTASEMNAGSVITNEEMTVKEGRVFSSEVCPRFSILNPEFTYTVPKYQMASGIFDILSHLMEQYFSGEDDNTSDYLLEGLMESLIRAARVALADPENYEARSNIMWCATMALNYITGVSKDQDWEVHGIEHQLGAYTDCAHGAGLAVISIPYYRYICAYGLKRFKRFAIRIFDVKSEGRPDMEVALEGIDRLRDFVLELGLPLSLKELSATEEMLPKIADTVEPGGGYKILSRDDILSILKIAYFGE